MASLLTLPRELRDEIIDILLLTNEPQTKVSSTSHRPQFGSRLFLDYDWIMFPRPAEQSATGLAQANHQLRAEVLQRSACLRSGIHHRLDILAYGLHDGLVARWVDAPIANGRLLNRLDIQIELSNITPSGPTWMYYCPDQLGDVLQQATHNVVCGCSNGPAHYRQRWSGWSPAGSSHFRHAIKEVRINVTCEDPTDHRLSMIATNIEKICLGSIPLKRTVKMRSEVPTLVHRYDATFWEQFGSISLQSNSQQPRYIWNVAQMFLDRTYYLSASTTTQE
jgi:hypothetical protein